MKILKILLPAMLSFRIEIFYILYKYDLKNREYLYMTEAAKYYKKKTDILTLFFVVFLFLEIDFLFSFISKVGETVEEIHHFLRFYFCKKLSDKVYDLFLAKNEPDHVEGDD